MGCDYSKDNCVYSLNCCFCKKPLNASYWIGIAGLVYGGFAMSFDWIQAHMHYEPCDNCLDYEFNKKLSYASAIIDSVQWCTNILLIHGLRKDWKYLLLPWLSWIVVYIAMQLTWVFITLPYTPTLRGFSSIFHSIWAVHYFIVIKTQYTMMAYTFEEPDGPLEIEPTNTPTRRRHKRQKYRADMNNIPIIRTLLGACVKLHEEQLKRRLLALQNPEIYKEKYGEIPHLRELLGRERYQRVLERRGIANEAAQLTESADASSSARKEGASHSGGKGSSGKTNLQGKEKDQEGNKETGHDKAGYIVMDMERQSVSLSTNQHNDNFCDDIPVSEKCEKNVKNAECSIEIGVLGQDSSDKEGTSSATKTSPENQHRRRASYKMATNNEGFDNSSEFEFL